MKYTVNSYLKKANLIHNNFYNYENINLEKGIKSYISIICPIHNKFTQRADHHIYGHGCKKCGNSRYNTFKYIEKAKIVHDNKYEYNKTIYIDSYNKIIITCKKHGDFKQLPQMHLFGQGCPHCKYDNLDDFLKKAEIVHGDIYDYTNINYINSYNYIHIRCKKHGIFKQRPKDHINRKEGCPICNMSKGENQIKLFLEKHKIKYIYQKKFKKCKNIKVLPFDFYLPEYNICIEFNGKQHYKPIKYYGGKKTFEYIKNNDIIKKNFCKKDKIHFLIINYNNINNIDMLLNIFILKIYNIYVIKTIH